LALVIALAANSRPGFRSRVVALLIVAGLPILLAFAISLGTTSVFTPKIFTPSAAIAPLLLAGGAAAGRLWIARVALAAVGLFTALAVISVIGQFRYDRKENWRDLLSYLVSRPAPPRLLVFVGNDGQIALEYYERRHGAIVADRVGAPISFYHGNPPRAMQRIEGPGDLRSIVDAVESGRYNSIVLIGTHMSWSDPSGYSLSYLDQRLRPIERRHFDGVFVEHFAPR
jgi:hypothetical protein